MLLQSKQKLTCVHCVNLSVCIRVRECVRGGNQPNSPLSDSLISAHSCKKCFWRTIMNYCKWVSVQRHKYMQTRTRRKHISRRAHNIHICTHACTCVYIYNVTDRSFTNTNLSNLRSTFTGCWGDRCFFLQRRYINHFRQILNHTCTEITLVG